MEIRIYNAYLKYSFTEWQLKTGGNLRLAANHEVLRETADEHVRKSPNGNPDIQCIFKVLFH